VVMAAAVADYRPRAAAAQKMKRSRGPVELALEPTPDILAELPRHPGLKVVGFALETENELAAARAKLRAKRCDLLVLNNPTRAARGADVARPDESREIARALRRYLEREADAGRGDLWAISARREATAPVATPATAPVATAAAAAPTAGVAEAELFDFSDPMS